MYNVYAGGRKRNFPVDRRHAGGTDDGYDCTPLFFWKWMDDPETPRSEKGFLRVLGCGTAGNVTGQEARTPEKEHKKEGKRVFRFPSVI